MVSYFSKLLMALIVLSITVFQMANSQYVEDDMPVCPNEFLVHYKDCKGELQQCANCLGVAEKKCDEAAKKKGASPYTCSQCTSSVNGNCNGIKRMCFGNQECGSNHRCIDYECDYQDQ